MAVIFLKKKISVGSDAEKLESLYIGCGNIKWFSCYGKKFGGNSMFNYLKDHQKVDAATSLLDIQSCTI